MTKLASLISLVMISALTGCKMVVKGIRIKHEDKLCFTRKELVNIIKTNNIDSGAYSYLFINDIVVNHNECIGLYGVVKTTLKSRYYSIDKVIKTKETIYLYSEDENINKEILDSFFKKYGTYFSEDEKEIFIKSFNKGSDIIGGRLY